MFSTSFRSADVGLAGDDLSLIDSTYTNALEFAPPGANEHIENLNFDDYLVSPSQDGADKLQQSSLDETVYLASAESILSGNDVDAPQPAAHLGLDLNARNLGSSSANSGESVNILTSCDGSSELPTLAQSTQPTLAEANIDHLMASSARDTS
jgi:hypothetical protein